MHCYTAYIRLCSCDQLHGLLRLAAGHPGHETQRRLERTIQSTSVLPHPCRLCTGGGTNSLLPNNVTPLSGATKLPLHSSDLSRYNEEAAACLENAGHGPPCAM